MLSESVRATVVEQETREQLAVAEPWFERRDIVVTALVIVLFLIGLLVSQKHWPGWARRVAARRISSAAELDPDELATFGVVVGPATKDWIETRFRPAWLAHKYLSWIQLLACYRPWGWRPRARLIGKQHLEDALARGRGVILFTANFAYKDLMSKAALADAGYPACHLVRDSHGFSETRLGKLLLNPIESIIERRFLRERLVFSGDRTAEVNALIKKRLSENQAILVTVTPLGRRVSVMPFLHGRINIATGALNFACDADAAVLPLFTIRRPDGRIDAIVEHPLKRPSDATRGEAIQAMLDDYVPRLETYAAQYSEQFAFPASNRHGRTLIEPWTSPAQQDEVTLEHQPALEPGSLQSSSKASL